MELYDPWNFTSCILLESSTGKQVSVKMCHQRRSSLDVYFCLKGAREPKSKDNSHKVHFESNLFRAIGHKTISLQSRLGILLTLFHDVERWERVVFWTFLIFVPSFPERSLSIYLSWCISKYNLLLLLPIEFHPWIYVLRDGYSWIYSIE